MALSLEFEVTPRDVFQIAERPRWLVAVGRIMAGLVPAAGGTVLSTSAKWAIVLGPILGRSCPCTRQRVARGAWTAGFRALTRERS
ncbi:MAG TPA: hypothetical protein EYP56_09595 [Planctomycetaceae bacterium]|nr:hypothetical protein [Planctomycetaceae bacterium]HIQ21745.1 hypothetical protein [Planctomycetota bacterium]